ncbi:NAD-dependent epimerase/dehydratase family protein, partial [Candidatus Undinarchaeota archaeon]
MKVLVTGASGFIGTHLTKSLIRQGNDVRALIRDKICEVKDVENVKGDVLNKRDLQNAMNGIDIVYHLAGILGNIGIPDEIIRKVNSDGTRNVLEAAHEAGVKRLYHFSTTGVFGAGTNIKEDTEYNPETIYEKSKLLGEKAAREFMNKLSLTIIRPGVIYGPGDKSNIVK